jgi:DNA (cytosine-5)-methyltransferase 1
MKYFSMFSGIGGFEYGIRQSEIKSENSANSQSGTSQLPRRSLCVGFSEIDTYAIQIYKNHFKGHKNYGDATKINTRELSDFDCLVGGFPCQAFSIAGKRRGFDEARGTLFFEIARILADKRPRCVVLENVKGLLSHDGGKTFQTILKVLSDIGYRIQWQVLNSKNFGVPQNRERVFIIGYLRGPGAGGRKIFPITGASTKTIRKTMNEGGNHSGGGVFDENGICPSITAGGTGGATNNCPKITVPVLTPDRVNKSQNGRRFKENGEPSFTLTAQDRHGIFDGCRIRRLTPTECERLQGFPDGWTEGISDTQRYKCLGNAVTTNVITAIFERLL